MSDTQKQELTQSQPQSQSQSQRPVYPRKPVRGTKTEQLSDALEQKSPASTIQVNFFHRKFVIDINSYEPAKEEKGIHSSKPSRSEVLHTRHKKESSIEKDRHYRKKLIEEQKDLPPEFPLIIKKGWYFIPYHPEHNPLGGTDKNMGDTVRNVYQISRAVNLPVYIYIGTGKSAQMLIVDTGKSHSQIAKLLKKSAYMYYNTRRQEDKATQARIMRTRGSLLCGRIEPRTYD